MAVTLQLMGGLLDGLYLPLTPGATVPPRQLIIYSPHTKTWTNYVDRKRRTGAIDVYKIRAGAKLPAEPPPQSKIVDLHYTGAMTPQEAKVIEQLARSHGA